jgi:hypothetical protein
MLSLGVSIHAQENPSAGNARLSYFCRKAHSTSKPIGNLYSNPLNPVLHLELETAIVQSGLFKLKRYVRYIG